MATDFTVRFTEMAHCDYEQEEHRKSAWLRDELRAGAEAAESEFVTLDVTDLLIQARKRLQG